LPLSLAAPPPLTPWLCTVPISAPKTIPTSMWPM